MNPSDALEKGTVVGEIGKMMTDPVEEDGEVVIDEDDSDWYPDSDTDEEESTNEASGGDVEGDFETRLHAAIRSIKTKEELDTIMRSEYQKCHKLEAEIAAGKGKSARELMQTESFINALDEALTHLSSRSVSILLANSKEKGLHNNRTCTKDDQIFYLELYVRNSKRYELACAVLPIPLRETLQGLLRRIPVEAGINIPILKQLSEIAMDDPKDKCCSLVFEETNINIEVYYCEDSDRNLGFQDFGAEHIDDKPPPAATKALVFMAIGIHSKWKQPVAFYFTNEGCTAPLMRRCLGEVLDALHSTAKLDVITTICDIGASKVECMTSLGVTAETPFFMHGDKKVFHIYDPPNLLKCTYNLFKKYNIAFPETSGNKDDLRVASFQDVKETMTKLQTLTDEMMSSSNLRSMKVMTAAKMFSKNTSSLVLTEFRTSNRKELYDTSVFIGLMNELFDSFNGTAHMVTPDSGHTEYWAKTIENIRQWHWKMIDKVHVKIAMPQSTLGWMVSLKAMGQIWEHLNKEKGFKTLRQRSFNKDPLENMFAVLLYGCGARQAPTVYQFIRSWKAQLLCGLNYRREGTNCQDDENRLLFNLRPFLDAPDPKPDSDTQIFWDPDEEKILYMCFDEMDKQRKMGK